MITIKKKFLVVAVSCWWGARHIKRKISSDIFFGNHDSYFCFFFLDKFGLSRMVSFDNMISFFVKSDRFKNDKKKCINKKNNEKEKKADNILNSLCLSTSHSLC